MSDLGVVNVSKLLFGIGAIVTKAIRALEFPMRSLQDFQNAKPYTVSLYVGIWNTPLRYGTKDVTFICRVSKKNFRYLCINIIQHCLSLS